MFTAHRKGKRHIGPVAAEGDFAFDVEAPSDLLDS